MSTKKHTAHPTFIIINVILGHNVYRDHRELCSANASVDNNIYFAEVN